MSFHSPKFYSLFMLAILLSVIRIVGPIRAIEVVMLMVLPFVLVRPRITQQGLLAAILFLAILIISLSHTSVSDISYAIRTISAILIFHVLFMVSQQTSQRASTESLFVILILFYAIGMYSYKWEYAYIFSCFIILFVFEKRYVWALIAFVLTYMVGQRAPFFAFLLYGVFWLVKGLSIQRLLIVMSVLLFFFALITFVPFFSESRIVATLQEMSLRNLLDAWEIATASAGNVSYETFVYDERATLTGSGDLSAHLRIRKWAKAYSDLDLTAFIFGLGPSYFGKGADSGIIRMFASYGAVVMVLYFAYFISLYKIFSPVAKVLIFTLLGCNLVLDVTFSILIMCVSGFLVGKYAKE